MSTNDSTSSAQKLRLPEGELLTVTDAIPIGISVLTPDGTTLHVNRMALDLLALTLDEVIGKGHLERTCHPDDLDRVRDLRRMGLSGSSIRAGNALVAQERRVSLASRSVPPPKR